MKYSIITPNYNGFSLMNRYFKSLQEQTFKDFEAIIVDDCSTDDSYEKLQQYAESSPFSITILQAEKNTGPGNARNMGIDFAKGEWITFIDNDDWVEPTFLEEIDNVINSNEVNCVIHDYFIKTDKRQYLAASMYNGDMGIVTISNCMSYARNHTIGKFYKLSECKKNGIRFPHTRRCEDVAFVCRAIEACGSAYYYHKPLYYYYQRPTSLSNNKQMDESDMITAFTVIEESLGPIYPAEIAEKSVTDLLYGGVLLMCKAMKSKKEIEEYIDWYERKYPNWKSSVIINYLGIGKKTFIKIIGLRFILILKIITWVHSRMVR